MRCTLKWFILTQRTQNLEFVNLQCVTHTQPIPLPLTTVRWGGGTQLFFKWGGGALNFFSGRGVRPGFPKCGACELTFASEKGGLWAENFQIWGLVSWKFPNLRACELKISKFGGLRAQIWVKIEAVEAKISKFSQKGVLWTDSFAWNGTLASGRRGVKRGSSGPHIPIPPF